MELLKEDKKENPITREEENPITKEKEDIPLNTKNGTIEDMIKYEIRPLSQSAIPDL